MRFLRKNVSICDNSGVKQIRMIRIYRKRSKRPCAGDIVKGPIKKAKAKITKLKLKRGQVINVLITIVEHYVVRKKLLSIMKTYGGLQGVVLNASFMPKASRIKLPIMQEVLRAGYLNVSSLAPGSF
jgi:ribosomal protein L14